MPDNNALNLIDSSQSNAEKTLGENDQNITIEPNNEYKETIDSKPDQPVNEMSYNVHIK